MTDLKEQKLIEAQAAAACKCAEAGRKWDAVDRKCVEARDRPHYYEWDEARCKWNEARCKWVEADHKWVAARGKLRKYRESKALSAERES